MGFLTAGMGRIILSDPDSNQQFLYVSINSIRHMPVLAHDRMRR